MGRGLNCTETTVASRSRAAGTEIDLQDFLAAEHDPGAAGELIAYGSEMVALQADDPVLAMRGLAAVDRLTYHPSSGHYEVFFTDGSRAMVSVDPAGVALESGEEDPVLIHGSLYAAQAQRARHAPDSAPARVLDLGDAESWRREAPGDGEALRLAAKAAVALNEDGDPVSVNPSSLVAELGRDVSVPNPVQRRRAARKRMADLVDRVAKVVKGPTPHLAPSALLFNADANGVVEIPNYEEKLASARRLGGEHLIPQSKIDYEEIDLVDEDGNPVLDPDTGEQMVDRKMTGEYHIGPQEEELISLVRNRIVNGGQRFMIFRGPQGTGKNAAASEIAAMLGMPLVQINLGPRYDINDALGGEGLAPAELYDDVPVIDPQTGLPKVDPDTKEVVTEKKLITAVAASKQIVGILTRAAQEKCVICLDEIEGTEADFVQLHGALGSDVGDPTKRFISVNSMSGAYSIPVDPDCIIIANFNSGAQEVHLPSATHDRAINFEFDYPEPEDEDKMLATMVTSLMNAKEEDGTLRLEAPGLAREYTAEDVKPIGDIVRRLRNAHKNDPDTFIDFPGGRQAAYMFYDVMKQGYDENEDAVRFMRHNLRYLLPGWNNMSSEERDGLLSEQFREYEGELNELVQLAGKIREDDEAAYRAQQEGEAKAKGRRAKNPRKPKAGAPA